jgi:hypothetical protein
MPIVLRIAEASFAESIARHFDFQTTFSVAALAGPVFAGLSRLPGARGRFAFDGQEFAIGEFEMGSGLEEHLAPGTVVLAAVDESGEFALARGFTGLGRGTRVLVMVPVAPYRDGTLSFAAVGDRIPAG